MTTTIVTTTTITLIHEDDNENNADYGDEYGDNKVRSTSYLIDSQRK